MIHTGNELSVSRKAKLLSIPRSSVYFVPKPIDAERLALLTRIDAIFTEHPMYGNRRLRVMLAREGIMVGRDLMRSCMQQLGLEATRPKPNTSKRNHQHKIYPYLLRGLRINRPNQVWSTDITYDASGESHGDIPMAKGYMYLTAVIDWYSRKVLSWRLSNTLETAFCVEALQESLAKYGKPEIFNTDQGSQFDASSESHGDTSEAFTGVLKEASIRISMDGRGRCHDNIFVERLWWTVKHEWVYRRPCDGGHELKRSLTKFFAWYNEDRPHQSLGYLTPSQIYETQSVHAVDLWTAEAAELENSGDKSASGELINTVPAPACPQAPQHDDDGIEGREDCGSRGLWTAESTAVMEDIAMHEVGRTNVERSRSSPAHNPRLEGVEFGEI